MVLWPSGNVVATDGVNILISTIDCSLPGGAFIYYYHHASLIIMHH